jgi:hypothetical protein
LVATTSIAYCVPFVSPENVHVRVGSLTVHVAPVSVTVAVYEAIADPPLVDGTGHVITAWPFPGVAVGLVAPGSSDAMTARTVLPVT